jgi:hypothetical protein
MDKRQHFIAVKTGVIVERVQTLTAIQVLKKDGSKLYFKWITVVNADSCVYIYIYIYARVQYKAANTERILIKRAMVQIAVTVGLPKQGPKQHREDLLLILQ